MLCYTSSWIVNGLGIYARYFNSITVIKIAGLKAFLILLLLIVSMLVVCQCRIRKVFLYNIDMKLVCLMVRYLQLFHIYEWLPGYEMSCAVQAVYSPHWLSL